MKKQPEQANDLIDSLFTCSTCGGELIEVSPGEVPEDVKAQGTYLPSDLMGYLYCQDCDKYSALGGGGSFYDDSEKSIPIKPASTPSRNALCPCGSEKKYKRCCGKN